MWNVYPLIHILPYFSVHLCMLRSGCVLLFMTWIINHFAIFPRFFHRPRENVLGEKESFKTKLAALRPIKKWFADFLFTFCCLYFLQKVQQIANSEVYCENAPFWANFFASQFRALFEAYLKSTMYTMYFTVLNRNGPYQYHICIV